MVDLGANKKRIAQLVRMLGTSGGERRNTFAALERTMQSGGISWTDLGDAIEHELSEDEIKQVYDAALADFERKHATNGHGTPSNSFNSTSALPDLQNMVQFCLDRVDQVPRQKDQDFIRDIAGRAIW